MADDSTKNKESEETSDVKGRSKGKLRKIILFPIILLLQAAIAYFLVVNFLIDKPEDPQDSEAKNHETETNGDDKGVGQFIEIKDIVINPAGTLGRRYFVVEVGMDSRASV